jgi:hypothetical protein
MMPGKGSRGSANEAVSEAGSEGPGTNTKRACGISPGKRESTSASGSNGYTVRGYQTRAYARAHTHVRDTKLKESVVCEREYLGRCSDDAREDVDVLVARKEVADENKQQLFLGLVRL